MNCYNCIHYNFTTPLEPLQQKRILPKSFNSTRANSSFVYTNEVKTKKSIRDILAPNVVTQQDITIKKPAFFGNNKIRKLSPIDQVLVKTKLDKSSSDPTKFSHGKKMNKVDISASKNLLTGSYSKFTEIKLITINLASATRIRQWAEKTLPNGKVIGEVINAETLHYKTFKPIKGGLFCERIFGPLKDHICACGKKFNLKTYLRQQGDLIPTEVGVSATSNQPALQDQEHQEAKSTHEVKTKLVELDNNSLLKKRYFCRLCDVEYTFSTIRRTQLGYIKLATPVTHVWFVKGAPNYMSILLDMKKKDLHQIIYNYGTLTFENAVKGKQLVFMKPSDLYATWAKVTKKSYLSSNKVQNVTKEKSEVFSGTSFLKLPTSKIYQKNKQSYLAYLQNKKRTKLKPTTLKPTSHSNTPNNVNIQNQFSNMEKNLFKKSQERFVSRLIQSKTHIRQKKVIKNWYTFLKQYFLKSEKLQKLLNRKLQNKEYNLIASHVNKKESIKLFENNLNFNYTPNRKYCFIFNKLDHSKKVNERTTLKGTKLKRSYNENPVLFSFLPAVQNNTFITKTSFRGQLLAKYKNLLENYTTKTNLTILQEPQQSYKESPYNESDFVFSTSTVSLVVTSLVLTAFKSSLSQNINNKLKQKYPFYLTEEMFLISSLVCDSNKIEIESDSNLTHKDFNKIKVSNSVFYKKLFNHSLSLFVSFISKEGYSLSRKGDKNSPVSNMVSDLQLSLRKNKNLSDTIQDHIKELVNLKTMNVVTIKSGHQAYWGFKWNEIITKTTLKNMKINKLVTNLTILLFSNLNKKYKSYFSTTPQNAFELKFNLKSKTNFNHYFKLNYSSVAQQTNSITKTDIPMNAVKTNEVTPKNHTKALRLHVKSFPTRLKSNAVSYPLDLGSLGSSTLTNFYTTLGRKFLVTVLPQCYEQFYYTNNSTVINILNEVKPNDGKTHEVLIKIFQNNLFSKLINNIYCLSHRFVWEEEKNWRRFSLYYYAPKISELMSIPIYKNRNYDDIFNFDSMGFLYTNTQSMADTMLQNSYGEGSRMKEQTQVIQARQHLKALAKKMNIYTTFSGPGIIEKLLNEFNFIELKKMDKQNRILLVEYNKHVAQLKKAIPIPTKFTTQMYEDTVTFSKSKKNNSSFKMNTPTRQTVKSRLEYYKACHIRDIAIRRTKLIRKLAIKAGSNSNDFTQNSDNVFMQPSSGPNMEMNVTSNLNMVLTVLPVLPPDLRPIVKMDGKQATADLNMFYKNIIYRNERLKKFLKDPALNNSFEMKYAQRLVQEAVDNLIQNGKSGDAIKDARGRLLKSLSDALKGKQGRFRQYLLGKRVDYSARSVIVVGPRLKIHECGIPKEIALTLYLPFLIKRILNEKLAVTVPGAKGLIQKQSPLIWQLLREIMKTCPVLLNRAPTLHRLGFQAFQPKLIDGKAILLHPLVCPAFNADFDGDQMAVHIPITNEAKTEAWKLMLTRNNLLSPATGEPIILPSQDMVLGCYYLTTFCTEKFTTYKKGTGLYFHNLDEVLKAYNQQLIHIHAHIWVNLTNLLKKRSVLDQSKLYTNKSSFAGRSNDQPLEIRVSMFHYKLAEEKSLELKTFTSGINYSATQPEIKSPLGAETPNIFYKTLIIYSKMHEFRELSSEKESLMLNTVNAFQIVRTTPGRILFNALIQKALSKSPTLLT